MDFPASLRLANGALECSTQEDPSPYRALVGGCRGEVAGVDVGRGVGCAQGCVSSVRRRLVRLRFLGYRAKRLHGGEPQVEVDPTAGDDQLGMARDRRRVLQDGVLGGCRVCLVQQRVPVVGGGPDKAEWVLGVLSGHAQTVLKPLHGFLVDLIRCARGDPRGPLPFLVP